MIPIYRALLLGLLALLGLGAGAASAPGAAATPPAGAPPLAATPSPTATCGWQLSPSHNPSTGTNHFFGVCALTPDDTWAVGVYNPGTQTSRPLAEHWDGQQWTVVPIPNGITNTNLLEDVVALAPDDVWAVGYYKWPTGPNQALIEHWDGATWSIVPSPAVFTEANELRNVAAIAPDDIWAVGYYCCVQGWTRPLVEHWDGTTWQVVPSPASGLKNNEFWDVAAFSAQDVWAVGGVMDDVHGVLHPLIEHWDGTTWQIVPSPDPPNPYGNYDTYLNGVAGSGPTDVWAVGSQWSGTLVEHWDGRRWTMFPAPSPGQVISFLYGVAVLSATNAWAVGEYSLSGGGGLALVLHWNGSCWALVPAPSPGAISNHLIRVAVSGTSDAWAVGHTWNGNGYPINTLAEHYVGPCPDPPGCPSPTPTATIPPSPTGTVTPTPPATATPSPSPTSTLCPIIFSDVDAGNPFYSYVRCLACHGLVGGYPCGGPGEPCGGSTNPPYFRPTANVTRGQLSKIIAGAAGFTDPIPSARQTFADVPPGSTFWPWIERLAARGAIGGYPCGGSFEPCADPANRPYFRPNNPATRGQISKIVSEAAGYRETPTAQTFADVPPGDPFYAYVERLAARGIVSGYPCGGPFEPCVGPGNRPYFRPGHHTTRGQLAKIAILPFFPGCDPPARR